MIGPEFAAAGAHFLTGEGRGANGRDLGSRAKHQQNTQQNTSPQPAPHRTPTDNHHSHGARLKPITPSRIHDVGAKDMKKIADFWSVRPWSKRR